MLAKVIAHGASRAEAAGRLASALTDLRIAGISTNSDLLVAILRAPAFRAGDTTTAFLDEHPELLAPRVEPDVRRLHLVACAVALLEPEGVNGGSAEPARGWRNVGGVPEVVSVRYRDGGDEIVTTLARSWGREGATYWIAVDTDGPVTAAQTIATDPRFEPVTARLESEHSWPQPEMRPARLEVDGLRRSVECGAGTDGVTVESDGVRTFYDVVAPWASSGHGDASGGPSTPVPGTVTHVAVAVGDVVEAGSALVVLEAMKMEHTIRADEDGVVAEIHVNVGQSVDAHTVVVTLAVSS
jgi:propionyl-CoA carboxylase alpha chain